MTSRNTLLPPTPSSLSRIDGVTVSEHFSLQASDICFYVWEQTARAGYAASPTNNLIANLKAKPGDIARTPSRNYYKQQALSHAAAALRSLLGQATVETQATFIPIPGSRIKGDSEYDDRIGEVLKRAFSGWTCDVRPLLIQTVSTQADHESVNRMSYQELKGVTTLASTSTPFRELVVIVDDVLNSGKHFKVAKDLVSLAYPSATIYGLFLARCIRRNNASSDVDGF